MTVVDEIIRLLNERGGSNYGREQVTQREHAPQAAALTGAAGAGSCDVH